MAPSLPALRFITSEATPVAAVKFPSGRQTQRQLRHLPALEQRGRPPADGRAYPRWFLGIVVKPAQLLITGSVVDLHYCLPHFTLKEFELAWRFDGRTSTETWFGVILCSGAGGALRPLSFTFSHLVQLTWLFTAMASTFRHSSSAFLTSLRTLPHVSA